METAEEFLEKSDNYSYKDDGGNKIYYDTQIKELIIEFAKLHIQELAKNPTKLLTDFGLEAMQEYVREGITTESILEAYPLNNIK